MTRNDRRLIVGCLGHPLRGRDQPVNSTTGIHVNEREGAVEEQISHVDHVRAPEKDRRVAVGVGVGLVPGLDRETVPMQGDPVLEGHDGKGFRSRLLAAADQIRELGGVHPPADVLVGHDEAAGLPQVLVPTGVIPVPVGVDHEPHRLVGDAPHRGEDLVGERRVLIVHQQSPVLTGGEADVAAATEEDVDAAAQVLAGDGDGVPVRVLGQCRERDERKADSGEDKPQRTENGWISQGHGDTNSGKTRMAATQIPDLTWDSDGRVSSRRRRCCSGRRSWRGARSSPGRD